MENIINVGDLKYKITIEWKEKRKYRTYYKAVLANIEQNKEKLLTFVLFNPSTADEYKFDKTLLNCEKIARLTGYNGFEIYNLLSIKNSKVKAAVSDENKAKAYNINTLQIDFSNKDIVLAWGSFSGDKNKPFIRNIVKEFINKIPKDVYTFCKNTKDYPFHPKNFNEKRCLKCHNNKLKLVEFDLSKIDIDKK